jgi:hypothetical protein
MINGAVAINDRRRRLRLLPSASVMDADVGGGSLLRRVRAGACGIANNAASEAQPRDIMTMINF